MTCMRLLVDGHVVARHDGPLVDDDNNVTPGTALWWLNYTVRASLPSRAWGLGIDGCVIESFEPEVT
jgi:hypothetical protein